MLKFLFFVGFVLNLVDDTSDDDDLSTDSQRDHGDGKGVSFDDMTNCMC
jgi:hypothetical protein